MKKYVLIVALLLIVAGTGVIYFFWPSLNKRIISPQFTRSTINSDDPNQVFNITPPADFDENKKQRLEEKISVAKELYNNKKNETWTWIVIGNMYEYIRDYDRAISAYEKALSINGNEMISLTNLGYIYDHQKGDFKKAEGYYLKAKATFPQVADNYFNLARLYEYKMLRHSDAEGVYLDGVKNAGNSPELLVALINFYQRRGNSDKTAEYARILLTSYPDNELYKRDFSGLIK